MHNCSIFGVIAIICMALNARVAPQATVTRDDDVFMVWQKEKLTWSDALKFCQLKNMSLISFDNAEKVQKINHFLTFKGYVDRSDLLVNDYIYWTSGNDLKTTGTFEWAATGAAFTYTNWLPNMPDNWRHEEHCVEMGYRELGKWNDVNCKHLRHFICERKVQKK